MKKAFSNKFVITGAIILLTGSIVYFTTWGNKKWLIDQISEKGGAAPDANGVAPTLQTMSVRDLQKRLISLT